MEMEDRDFLFPDKQVERNPYSGMKTSLFFFLSSLLIHKKSKNKQVQNLKINMHTLKEIQPVHPKGNQSWMFIGRADVEAETPIFWPPDAQSWLIGKDPDAGKDWWQKEKGAAEGEMVTQHHWLNVDLSKPQEIVEDRGTCHDTVQGFARVKQDFATEKQQHPK